MNGLVWGGLGAAALAGIAAWYFGLGGVAKVIRSVLGALGDAAATGRRWLAIPGNKLRVGAIVFALGFISAGLQSWQRGTVIIQQRADYVALQDRTRQDIARLETRVSDRDATIAQFVALAEQQMVLIDVARRQAEAAQDEADRARAAAATAEQRFMDAFDNRPPECEAALQVMARACPTLKDY